MRRDMDLIRELLLKLEAMPLRAGAMTTLNGHASAMHVEGKTADEITHHLTMLRDAGLIESPGSQPAGGITFRTLTWEGADFLDAVRDPEVWKKTKEGASRMGGWTFDLLKDMGRAYLKHVAKERLGLDL